MLELLYSIRGVGTMHRLLPIAILPSIILGSYIYFKDKKEKESPKLLLKLFLSGILAALVADRKSVV